MDLFRPLLLVLGVLAVAVAVAAAAEQAKPVRPHILLVVLDDVGRADTGVYGKVSIPMPNLVNLGKQGVVLENFYTQTVCSPTRSSLMTGKFPFRFGMQHFTTQLPGMSAGIPLDTAVLPKLLGEAGYDTHMIGKWHCGYATWGHTPHHRGFNSYFGILQAQGDYYKHNVALFPNAKPLVEKIIDGLDFWDNNRPLFAAVGNHSLDLYNHRVTKVLEDYVRKHPTSVQQQARPLFVYLAHQTVHIPLEAQRDQKERCGKIAHAARRVYCSMLVELDDSLGDLVAQYKAHHLWENTLVVVLSDNGGMVNFDPKPDGYPNFPASQGSNYPLRGSKTTLFEGGVRSMALLTGGHLPANQVGKRYKGLAHVVDLSATVLGAAGLFPLKRELLQLDGQDLLPLLQNAPGSSPRTVVPINLVNKGQSYSAIRFGKYKLIVRHLMFTSAMHWYDSQGDLLERGSGSESNTMLLFDLDADDRERKNLAPQHPELVQLGLDLIESYVNGGEYMEPQQASGVHPEALPLLHGGAWFPFQTEAMWSRSFARQQARNRVVVVGEAEEDEDDSTQGEAYVLVAGDNRERAQQTLTVATS